MTIPTQSYLNPQGELAPGYRSTLTLEELRRGYRVMALARHIDDRMLTLQRQGTISFAMSAWGEEACAVASAAALKLEDWMYPQYREAGILFWRGFTPLEYIHQMFGDSQDRTFGRQMPNHFGDNRLNVVTVSSPIATKIPHAAGCAYAMKVQREQAVTICYFGEGATSEGDFHAGVNFAAVRKVPAIFFCRNNGYAISTPCERQFASDGVAAKGAAYGIPALRVDGNDFFAVHDAVAEARRHCLAGKGPFLIEAMTFRMGAHSTSDDPSVYRRNEEVEAWKEKDPILRLKRYLERQKLWDAKQEEEMVKSINEEVTAAIQTAKETAPPPFEYLVKHVYFEVPPALKAQYEYLHHLYPR